MYRRDKVIIGASHGGNLLGVELTPWKGDADGKYSEGGAMRRLASIFSSVTGVCFWNADPLPISLGVRSKALKTSKAELYIGFHSNAGGAAGTRVLYFRWSRKSKEVAQAIVDNLPGYIDTPLPKIVPSTWLWMLRRTYCPAVIIEWFFHDNPDDLVRFMEREQEYLRGLNRALKSITV